MPARVSLRCSPRVGRGGAALVAACMALLTWTPPAGAQTVTGTIQGTVVDTTQASLPGVAIVIKNVETGASQDYVTNERGFFNAPFLPLGRYEVSATLDGFGPVTRRDVEVTTELHQRHQLQARSADHDRSRGHRREAAHQQGERRREAVDVGGADPREADVPEPEPDQYFLALAETFAGFNENPMSGQNNPTASSGSSVNFNGTGTRGTTFQIDGVNNDDSSENQNRQGVNVASIKEFQVITNAYSAEFGRGSGAVVLVQTKSGTNQLHGEGSYTRQRH